MNALLFAFVVVIWGLTWFAISLELGPTPAETSIFWRFLISAAVMWAGAGADRAAQARAMARASVVRRARPGAVQLQFPVFLQCRDLRGERRGVGGVRDRRGLQRFQSMAVSRQATGIGHDRRGRDRRRRRRLAVRRPACQNARQRRVGARPRAGAGRHVLLLARQSRLAAGGARSPAICPTPSPGR